MAKAMRPPWERDVQHAAEECHDIRQYNECSVTRRSVETLGPAHYRQQGRGEWVRSCSGVACSLGTKKTRH
jgi:hypothetical protein